MNIGVSPSGKAVDSDSTIPVFESQYPSQKIKQIIKKLLSVLFLYPIIYLYDQSKLYSILSFLQCNDLPCSL